jgi:hypothetical protein
MAGKEKRFAGVLLKQRCIFWLVICLNLINPTVSVKSGKKMPPKARKQEEMDDPDGLIDRIQARKRWPEICKIIHQN